MATPEQPLPPSEPQPLTNSDLIAIAEDSARDQAGSGRGVDFLASFTSFLNTGIPYEKALAMLGINAEEAWAKLVEIRQQQTESLKQNVETARGLGDRALKAIASLNPLRALKKD